MKMGKDLMAKFKTLCFPRQTDGSGTDWQIWTGGINRFEHDSPARRWQACSVFSGAILGLE
jgi:hypothetical protein